MNIAEICFSRSWGGLEHYAADTTILLAKRGHNVLAIAYPNTPIWDKLTNNGLYPIPIKAHNYVSPIATLHMTRLFIKHQIHSVHIHRTQDLGTVLAAAQLAKVPVRVLTLQMESDRKKQDVYHKWVYGQLTYVLTITRRMKELMIGNVAVNPDKIIPLYYGIDIDGLREKALPRNEIRGKWGIPDDAFVSGLVGRIEPSKGQEVLIRAAASLNNRIPELTVMIVGDETVGQSGEKMRMELLARDLAPQLKVVYTGYQSPPGSIVPAFDVSVLASKKETFGLVVIEAQALGIPVIATDSGGVPEIIEHGVNGLLTRPRDHVQLAEAIEQLYNDKELRAMIGRVGRQTTELRFGLERHLSQLERALSGERIESA